MIYVTYDADGQLTGLYRQDIQALHAESAIIVDENVAKNWTSYKANAQRDGVEPAPPVSPSQDETIARYEQALDAHLDAVAKAHRFSNGRHALALRAAYPNYWQALGIAYGTWMDQCNIEAYSLLQSVLAGQAQKPTLEEFIDGLPAFEP